MTKFVTTIGYTVYVPTRESIADMGAESFAVLAHEYRHAKDAQKYTRIIFGLLYLLPQAIGALGLLFTLILVPLLIFGIVSWSLHLLPFILVSLLLLPVPAYFRMKSEVEGYTMSMFVAHELQKNRDILAWDRAKLLTIMAQNYNLHFINSNYYYMWPFGVEKKLIQAAEKILIEELVDSNPIYADVLDALKASKS
ncbi:MAG: hypothetical protein Q8P20_09500 [bacterium]|nr:hypothetical protein [bacterium]